MPTGACSFQELYVALQMVKTLTLSASRRGADPSQKLLTHLSTLPPISPDQSILAIPEELGHGDICVCCLCVSFFCEQRWKWFAASQLSLSQPRSRYISWLVTLFYTFQHNIPCLQQWRVWCFSLVLYRTRWPLLAIERKEGGRGQWQQRVDGSPTWK